MASRVYARRRIDHARSACRKYLSKVWVKAGQSAAEGELLGETGFPGTLTTAQVRRIFILKSEPSVLHFPEEVSRID